MTYSELQTEVRKRLIGTDMFDIYESPDFQCYQTGGFPTMLFACFERGIAWLEPNYDMALEDTDMSDIEQRCADFGIRTCTDAEDFNNILRKLGKDAFESAELPEEDEGMGGI